MPQHTRVEKTKNSRRARSDKRAARRAGRKGSKKVPRGRMQR